MHMFGGYGEMGYGEHILGLLFMIIFWIAIVFLAIFLVKKFLSSSSTTRETPLEILKKRYARGDITKEEFEQMKRDLE